LDSARQPIEVLERKNGILIIDIQTLLDAEETSMAIQETDRMALRFPMPALPVGHVREPLADPWVVSHQQEARRSIY
jgi:hypothetical protein